MSDRQFVEHRPCPKCGSGDNLAVYDDGYAKCFSVSCGFWTRDVDGGGAAPVGDDGGVGAGGSGGGGGGDGGRAFRPVEGEPQALTARRITQETCEKWRYHVADVGGKRRQVANYYRDNKLVGQKIRFPDKSFRIVGEGKNLPLYGQWLWRDGGKKLVVTEGEIDALSMSQVQGNKWPVVSVPNGAQSAARAIQQNLEWVEKFDLVVFMFDMDEPGQAAARECAELLRPGKAAIAALPLKDANEMLVAGRTAELLDAMWAAKVFRPDGIVSGEELWEEVTREVAGAGVPYPLWCDGLNDKLRGVRRGELVTVTAGSGIGKSSLCRQLAVYLAQDCEQRVGYIALEESSRITTLSMMGIHAGQRWATDFRAWSDLTPDERAARRAAFDATIGTGRYYFYKHFGSTSVDNMLNRIRYLTKGCGCTHIFVDHLSILVSALDDESGLDERKLIDRAMTLLRTLVEETNCAMFVVSHLKRPGEGKPWDKGRVPSMSDLRGSASIEQLSDAIIALSRDMMDDTNLADLWVLKNRPIGMLGNVGMVRYDLGTGLFSQGEAADAFTGDDY